MVAYILSGVLAVGVVTVFIVLVRRSLRWSYPAGGQGPGYVPDGAGHAPDSAAGGFGGGDGGGGGDC